MHKFSVIWLSVFCLFLGCAKERVSLPSAQNIPLSSFLAEMNDKLGCHFTLEYRSGLLVGDGLPEEVHEDLNINSISALVSKLSRDLKGFRVVRDTKNAK